MAFLYSITHRETGREYIGVTSRSVKLRWYEHQYQAQRGRKTYIASALRKHGVDAFDFRVEAQLPTHAESLIAERIAVALRRPAFNLTVGGDGTSGYTHTAETRSKLRAQKLGTKRSAETNAKIVAKQLGRKRPAHAVEASRLSNMGNKHGVGVKHSAEAIEKTASAHRGAKRSAETCERMSAAAKLRGVHPGLLAAAAAANTGKKRSPETRERIAAGMRAAIARKKAQQLCP